MDTNKRDQPDMDMDMVFEDVVKTYGAKRALDGLDLRLSSGSVTALLGPNGAGKTTSVSLMLGLTKPSAGAVRIGGLPPGHRELRERIGAMLQETPAPDGLTVKETLQLFRSYYKRPLPLERLLQASGLEREAGKRASSLSGGQKRRLAFAVALAGDPDMIVLDEPTVGMDVESRIRFWDIVKGLAARGKTILLTTHYLEEADAVADRIAVIAEGKLVAQGSPAELKAAMPLRRLSFRTLDEALSLEALSAMPGVEQVEAQGGVIRLLAADTDKLLRRLFARGIAMSDIQVEAASLETVFRQLTSAESSEPQGSVRS